MAEVSANDARFGGAKKIESVREYAKVVELRRLEKREIDLPPFPADMVPYLRMNIRDLSPNEYWETSVNDIEMAHIVHHAWRQGTEDAERDHRKRQERASDEQKQLDRLKQRAG